MLHPIGLTEEDLQRAVFLAGIAACTLKDLLPHTCSLLPGATTTGSAPAAGGAGVVKLTPADAAGTTSGAPMMVPVSSSAQLVVAEAAGLGGGPRRPSATFAVAVDPSARVTKAVKLPEYLRLVNWKAQAMDNSPGIRTS
jgi:hypothetical protein